MKNKQIKDLAKALAEATGMDVEIVDLDNPGEDASPEALELAKQIRKDQADQEQKRAQKRKDVAKLSKELLTVINQNCCDKAPHRRVPKNPDDALAINNAMAALMTQYGAVVIDYMRAARGIIDGLLGQLGKEMHPRNADELAEFDLEMSAVHSILAAHFDLVAREGRIDYSTHYAKIEAVIAAWSEGKETGKREAGTTH